MILYVLATSTLDTSDAPFPSASGFFSFVLLVFLEPGRCNIEHSHTFLIGSGFAHENYMHSVVSGMGKKFAIRMRNQNQINNAM